MSQAFELFLPQRDDVMRVPDREQGKNHYKQKRKAIKKAAIYTQWQL